MNSMISITLFNLSNARVDHVPPRFDEEAIEQAVSAGMPYIALVANKRRSEEVLASLRLRGRAKEELAGVRTKPGLAIGAQTPEEIGLSIVAEIVKELRAG